MSKLILLLAFLPNLAAQPDRFALPACDSPTRELARRPAFVLCYDSNLKVPAWTAYELTPARTGGSLPRPSHFRHDDALAAPSAFDSDFRNTGYSRGHMVPAEDLAWSQEALDATFLLSNAAPQNQQLNASLWRRLENQVRSLAAASDAVYIFTGPIFDSPQPAVIGASRVAVPTHFFKVILAIQGNQKRMFAAIVPNAPQPTHSLDSFAVSVSQVQQRTGLDFFRALDDEEEQALESSIEAPADVFCKAR